jgi:ATP-dependent DNA ligase
MASCLLVASSDGIDAILAARQGDGSDTAFAAFDVLHLHGHDVMVEPWTDRRKPLEDVLAAGISEPRLQFVPASDDGARLWAI